MRIIGEQQNKIAKNLVHESLKATTSLGSNFSGFQSFKKKLEEIVLISVLVSKMGKVFLELTLYYMY